MATTRQYLVSFSPVQKQPWGGYSVLLSLMMKAETHIIEASSLNELTDKVGALAKAFGKTCSPYVRMANPHERKPPGFDKWCNSMHIIEVEG